MHQQTETGSSPGASAPAPVSSPSDPDPHHRWEFVAAIILSLATVLSAWSGYESTRWGAKATRANRDAATTLVHAATANNSGDRERTTDTGLFTEWVRAVLDEDPDRAAFVEARFRPGFLPAFHEWLGDTVIGSTALPPGSPFDSKQYQTAGSVKSQELFAEAEALQTRADRASRTGQTYVLIAVLYASVLFFGGISTKLKDRRASRLLVVMAALALIGATAELATQPVLFLIH